MNEPNIKRIPRPKGITNSARTGTRNQTYDKMIGSYLKGNIPNAIALSAYEFGLLYNIPDQMIQARVKDGLVSGLIQDNNLIESLEAERLKLLSSSLHRLGNSDFQLERLLAYLAKRILLSPGAPADLIKELNAAIGTQVRLTETSFKGITILNQALASVIQEAPTKAAETQLTREEILAEIEAMKLEPHLETYLEGTPNLKPHNLGAQEKAKLNVAAAHEFNPAEEVEPILIPASITVPPK